MNKYEWHVEAGFPATSKYLYHEYRLTKLAVQVGGEYSGGGTGFGGRDVELVVPSRAGARKLQKLAKEYLSKHFKTFTVTVKKWDTN